MQINLNRITKPKIIDAYQFSRLPKNEDLTIFHDILKGLSKKRKTKELIFLDDLKQFLSFSKSNFKIKKNIYIVYFLGFLWFKLTRIIVRAAENFYRRSFK